jgi:class 3 adenylate cyclase
VGIEGLLRAVFTWVVAILVAGCAPRTRVESREGVFDLRSAEAGSIELTGAWRVASEGGVSELVDPGKNLALGVHGRRFTASDELVRLEADLLLPASGNRALYVPRSNATSRIACAGGDGASFEGGAKVRGERLIAAHAPYVVVVPRSERVRCTMTIDQSGSVRPAILSSPPRLEPLEGALAGAWHERAGSMALVAFLLTMASYFFVQWRLHRRESSAIEVTGLAVALAYWFAAFRGLVATPTVGIAELVERFEFAAIGAAVLFGSRAIASFRAVVVEPLALTLHRGCVAALALACVVVPKHLLLGTLRLEQVVALALGVADVVRLGGDARRVRFTSSEGLLFVGFLAPVVLGVVDVAMTMLRVPLGVAPFGIVVLVFALAAVHALRAAEARATIERLAASLERTNHAISRFVPREFLSALGHRDVTSTALGDAIEREMTVLFADIRGFTTLAERLSPGATFELLNGCLARLGPHIRVQGGFIDKYIGDAILALFPSDPAGAVRAAIAMQRELGHVGVRPTGRGSLAVGVGIHRGKLMLGTIGEAERFEATVISDAVNLTARLEALTKQLGCGILVSADVAEALDAETLAFARPLGPVVVKGRRTTVSLVEIFAADEDEARADKAATRDELARAWEDFAAGQRAACLERLRALHRAYPADTPVAWWVEQLTSDEGELAEDEASGPRALVLHAK